MTVESKIGALNDGTDLYRMRVHFVRMQTTGIGEEKIYCDEIK